MIAEFNIFAGHPIPRPRGFPATLPTRTSGAGSMTADKKSGAYQFKGRGLGVFMGFPRGGVPGSVPNLTPLRGLEM
jgi:hypothetical protein